MAAPAALPGWKGSEPTWGHSGPVALPASLWMLGQRGLGHPPRFSPLTSDRGPWPLGCCSVETATFSTSTPNRPQLRPRPRGKALAGLILGRRPGMSGHTPGDLLLHGAVPLEARKIWARLPKGTGRAGLSLWSVRPLSRTGLLPVEDFPGCFQRPVCKHSSRLFPKDAHSAPKPGRKALGWSTLKALGPEPGDQPGGPKAQANSEAHAKVCSCPLHLQRARLSPRFSGRSLTAPGAPPGWEGAEPT